MELKWVKFVKSMTDNFNKLLDDFAKYLDNIGRPNDYVGYVRTINKNNGGSTMLWLNEALTIQQNMVDEPLTIQQNKDGEPKLTPIGYLTERFDECFENISNIKNKTKDDYKVGLMWLWKYVCGFNDSTINLQSIRGFELTACQLIAQSAIFCTKEVFEKVISGECGSYENKKNNGNKYGSWYYCKYQRARVGQKRREVIGNITLDDNTYANSAIKYAILEGLEKYGIHKRDKQIFKGFEACHIWPNTCIDARYHTSVANLVLIPREIAGLTDHCDAVVELLKYEAWKRFGFKPEEEDVPQRPKYYKDVIWRNTL